MGSDFLFLFGIFHFEVVKKQAGLSVSPAAVLLILQLSVHIPWVPAVLPRFQNIPALSEVSTVQFFQSHSRECSFRCLIFLTLSGFYAPFTFKRRSFNYEKYIFPRIYILNSFQEIVKLFSPLQIDWLFTTWNSAFGTIEAQNRGYRSNYTHPLITALLIPYVSTVSGSTFPTFFKQIKGVFHLNVL